LKTNSIRKICKSERKPGKIKINFQLVTVSASGVLLYGAMNAKIMLVQIPTVLKDGGNTPIGPAKDFGTISDMSRGDTVQ
jgi:hypothetical protein